MSMPRAVTTIVNLPYQMIISDQNFIYFSFLQ